MTRLVACPLVGAALLLATTAAAVPVDLVDGSGSLYWETTISVTSPIENTYVDHPNFPSNRHPHEGWFLYVVELDLLHEFTAFTKTTDGVSQDSLSAAYTIFTGDTFTLDLNYGITASGTSGLPDLAWSGSLGRTNNPASPFPLLNVRLFNVFDYDVGLDGTSDTASLVQTLPTVFELAGTGGVTGFRGASSTSHHTAVLVLQRQCKAARPRRA